MYAWVVVSHRHIQHFLRVFHAVQVSGQPQRSTSCHHPWGFLVVCCSLWKSKRREVWKCTSIVPLTPFATHLCTDLKKTQRVTHLASNQSRLRYTGRTQPHLFHCFEFHESLTQEDNTKNPHNDSAESLHPQHENRTRRAIKPGTGAVRSIAPDAAADDWTQRPKAPRNSSQQVSSIWHFKVKFWLVFVSKFRSVFLWRVIEVRPVIFDARCAGLLCV